jgi:hypothetical protein
MTTTRSRAGSPRPTPLVVGVNDGKGVVQKGSVRGATARPQPRPDREPQLYGPLFSLCPGDQCSIQAPDALPISDPEFAAGQAGRPSRRIWPGPLELLSLAQERDCWRLLKRPDAEGQKIGVLQ